MVNNLNQLNIIDTVNSVKATNVNQLQKNIPYNF